MVAPGGQLACRGAGGARDYGRVPGKAEVGVVVVGKRVARHRVVGLPLAQVVAQDELLGAGGGAGGQGIEQGLGHLGQLGLGQAVEAELHEA